MSIIKERIFFWMPTAVQNVFVSVFNFIAYNKRYSGKYKFFLNKYAKNKNVSLQELKKIQRQKFKHFVSYATANSRFYKSLYQNITNPEKLENIKYLPILSKEDLRQNLPQIYTVDRKKGNLSKTGGTTGKSLEVLFTDDDVQERFAILDNFRHELGYVLGKKTAWFSGKNLISKKDLKKSRFWKTDYLYKVRYYSTFHIHRKYLKHYVEDLINFKPEFMVGFPSTMYEIAKFGIDNDLHFPKNVVKAIFPTAETVTLDIRKTLENYFKTKVYNQYASSEGAPFILECDKGNLHLELQSGVFEVLDNKNNPSRKGRLVITSFNSHGTPLIRYDIGDQIILSDTSKICGCGNNNPLVDEIQGRISDHVFSEETGKINLGNISNCLKDVKGIVKFQIKQDLISEIQVLVEKDGSTYHERDEAMFLKNLKDRLGNNMNIKLTYVDAIPVEKSGKFRLIKNNIKFNSL